MLKKLILTALAASTLIGCNGQTATLGVAAMPDQPLQAQAAEPAAVHGMLIVGDKNVFLSHLSMFHAPHNYQAIMEAQLGQAAAVYTQDRAKTGTKVYTLVPEPFVLSQTIAAGKSFKADIFRGHFERGGKPIATKVTVTIKNVVHFRKFDPAAQAPRELNYLLFGKERELFLAHLITAPPDYDQVLAVDDVQFTRASKPLTDNKLAKGMQVTIGQPNTTPLQANTRSSVAIEGISYWLETGTEFYHETGDLAH